jgi:hypothetical protein
VSETQVVVALSTATKSLKGQAQVLNLYFNVVNNREQAFVPADRDCLRFCIGAPMTFVSAD